MTVTSDDSVATRRRHRPLQPLVHQPDAKELREWAIEEGYEITDHGRIPSEIQAAWAEHQLERQGITVPW
jgi:hypothetical protein